MGHRQRSEGKLVYLETVYCVLCVGDVSLKSHWLQAIGRRVSPTSRVLVFHIMSRWALIWGNSGPRWSPAGRSSQKENRLFTWVCFIKTSLARLFHASSPARCPSSQKPPAPACAIIPDSPPEQDIDVAQLRLMQNNVCSCLLPPWKHCNSPWTAGSMIGKQKSLCWCSHRHSFFQHTGLEACPPSTLT
jgi:hypothetical protein